MAELVSETNPFPVTVVGGGATGGTATGGSTSTLADSAQSLVPNSYIGATLYITHGGATYPETVLSNTATTFVFAASTNTYAKGDTYGVVMPATAVTSTDSGVLATGVTQPTGGVGLTGLLSGIWGWISGQLPTYAPKVTASLYGSVALLQDNLTLTGAYQQLPNTPCRSITIQAEPTNGGFVYIGNFNTVSSANHICTLSPGSSVTILASNFDQVFVIGTAGDAVCVGGEQ
jgi:hypothetical protein